MYKRQVGVDDGVVNVVVVDVCSDVGIETAGVVVAVDVVVLWLWLVLCGFLVMVSLCVGLVALLLVACLAVEICTWHLCC